MSGFSDLLGKLGFGKKKEEESKAPSTSSGAKVTRPTFERTPAEKNASTRGGVQRAASSRNEKEMVDVVSKLDGMAKASAEKLDWKVSIVDLLKLLDLDSSREARTEMAKELKIPADQLEDSAKMNVWLHKKVLQEVAANGGNVPKELLD
jgi:hypothetical protein